MAPDLRPTPGFKYANHKYGHHELQRIGIWEREGGDVSSSDSYWIVYIHGGGWRDPRDTNLDFAPTAEAIVGDKDFPQDRLRGFASIDYRLSGDGAKHPDHILDVRSALALLHQDYNISDKYILVGHSAGGTLAFQLLMEDAALQGKARTPVPLPTAVIGTAGIYDLVGLNERVKRSYTDFMAAAFGDEKDWNAASPAKFTGSYKTNWLNGKLAVLASSPDDTLVDVAEVDVLEAKLLSDGVPVQTVKDLTGQHDVVWEEGVQTANLVAKVISQLD